MAFIAAAALVAGAVGAGVSYEGKVHEGQAVANAANYSAAVAKNNEEIANENAAYALASGRRKAADTSTKTAAQVGKIKTAQAANNIDVNTGSAARVQEGQRETGKLDTETVMNDAELQAYGYRSNATSFEAESRLQSLKAEEAPIAARTSANAGLLGDASSLGMKWASLGAAPAPSGG